MKKKVFLGLAFTSLMSLMGNAQEKGSVEIGGQIGLNVLNASSSEESIDSKVQGNI